MIKVKRDLTGMEFGRLKVLEQTDDYISPKGKHYSRWLCMCNCKDKTITKVRGSSLLTKNNPIRSCGCVSKEKAVQTGHANKKYNSFNICGDYVTMYTLKQEPFYVDLEDFERVRDICWHKSSKGYIGALVKKEYIFLHDLIMNPPKGMIVDHIHGEMSRNDNRKTNLRIGTYQDNLRNCRISKNNTSGVTGVVFRKDTQKWQAQIVVNFKNIHLGSFQYKDDAIKARKEAEEKYFGEWSYDNSQKMAQERSIL